MQSFLSPQFNTFRIQLPEHFFNKELIEKYSSLYIDDKVLMNDPVEFLNNTIVSIDFLGIGNGTLQQSLTTKAYGDIRMDHLNHDFNKFTTSNYATDYSYRAARNILTMIDKTIDITFKHTLGFWNYFMMFEQFIYQTLRETKSDDEMFKCKFNLDILDPRTGEFISKVTFIDPLIDKIDSLTLSNLAVHPEAKEFKVTFKYNNIDYQFAPNIFKDPSEPKSFAK